MSRFSLVASLLAPPCKPVVLTDSFGVTASESIYDNSSDSMLVVSFQAIDQAANDSLDQSFEASLSLDPLIEIRGLAYVLSFPQTRLFPAVP